MKRPALRSSRRPPTPYPPGVRPRPQSRHIFRRNTATLESAVEGHCPIKAACGNCRYVNLDYRASLAEKHALGIKVLSDAGLLSQAHVVAPVPSPKPHGYRSLFKLAVRRAPVSAAGERFAIGLFRPGSHHVVNIDGCPLHTEPLQRLLVDLRQELESSSLLPFDEGSGGGTVRYLVARAAHLTGEILLTFVVTEPAKAALRQIVTALQRRGHKINAAHMNLNAGIGNAIFGPTTVRIAGGDGLRERLCDLDLEIASGAFFQVNPWQATNLYRRIEQIVGRAPERGTAWDLYCGTGQIALILARLGYRVLAVEENASAAANASANASRNRLSSAIEFVAARVEDCQAAFPQWSQSPQAIVVNPSRRGLAETTRRALALTLANNPDLRLVYVSCDVATLGRDLGDLTARTTHRIRQVESFDMFAQTEDLEWLAVLSR